MRSRRVSFPWVWMLVLGIAPGAQQAQSAGRDYPVKPVPFTAVHVSDSFWAPRIEVNRKATIPVAFKRCEETGRVDLFERAAKALRGEPLENRRPPGYPFDDTDVYKVIEGAAYALAVQRDPELEAYVDRLIEKIQGAQEPDGYIYTTRTINPVSPHRWAGSKRWELERVDSHELYNAGHLYEAAAAYYQATGKRTLLDVAIRSADLLTRTFGPGKEVIWPGHQITEMGLVRLYRVTGKPAYLDLAKFLLDVRGPDGKPGSGRTYNQSHKRVVEQTEAVGHAVRATYMYSGMADVAAMTGDQAYINALSQIWRDVVGRKLYITGGIGARGAGEAFGEPYELPNMTAYCETCASIGNDFWNHRMFLLTGDAEFIDVMERTLYNGLISGVSLDGTTFFYPNPLESNGQHQRSPWFGVACCPGNIARFMPSVPGYVYAQRGDELWVNLFIGSSADVQLDGGPKVRLTQQTRYPWEGAVQIQVEPEKPSRFTVHVRIPGWARNQPTPSDLYRYADRAPGEPSLTLNGRSVPMELEKGYVSIARTWRKGDTLVLNLPMAVRRVVAHEKVEADRGRVALQRGPLVYALEWADVPGGKVRNLMLPDSAPLSTQFEQNLLKGVVVVKGKAVALAYDAEGKVRRTEQDFTAIPYYAWANRGPGQMMVWIPNQEASAKPAAYPTLATSAKVTTSGKKNPRMINDGEEPRSSSEPGSYFDWWPTRGTTEWVEYRFEKPVTVSECEVYWFDDTGRGQVRTPASWRVLYLEGDSWKAVEEPSGYGTERDKYNRVKFRPVTTQALRLEVTMQANFSAGIQEWKVR